jgi:RNA polymerase sigma factor for flagellar operon FliA
LEIPTDTAAAAELPPYQGVAIADVVLVDTPAAAIDAHGVLSAQTVLGFDTEAKPTFAKGEVSTGPHLIQLATEQRVYLFPVRPQMNQHAHHHGLKEILESRQILKVGFGLSSDLAQLRARLGIEVRHLLDLSRALPGEKPRHALGAKTAVARYLGCRMQKSKRITTSNWAQPRLNERQMLYAADDAQVALRIYRLALAAGHLPPA